MMNTTHRATAGSPAAHLTSVLEVARKSNIGAAYQLRDFASVQPGFWVGQIASGDAAIRLAGWTLDANGSDAYDATGRRVARLIHELGDDLLFVDIAAAATLAKAA